jgi:hypothetical protein
MELSRWKIIKVKCLLQYDCKKKISLCSADLRTAKIQPPVFEEFQQKFPDFEGTYRQFALITYFVFPCLKNNVFKNRSGTIPESMQVITDICNLIDVETLRRSFEN